MKRFENAQVNDEIYCRLKGNGIIKSTTYSERYPLECFFEKYNSHGEYNLDGRHAYYCEEAILFYRKGEEKYLTERPEPDVDWSKVPIGTKVYCTDRINEKAEEVDYFVFYNPKHNFPFWILVETDKAAGYKYCKLAEPIKPEWIKK